MIKTSKNLSKNEIFASIRDFLESKGFSIEQSDMSRPWGGFFVIKEEKTKDFVSQFFGTISTKNIHELNRLSPKILVVAPNKRLSWQYHHRRSEAWTLISGRAAIIRSDSDKEDLPNILKINEVVKLEQGERHRLIGTDEWGVIAEIWIHSDRNHPSDEDDIIRIQDDYGR